MRALTEEWVNKADHDYEMTRRALPADADPLTDMACFHAQQCAEKYLKAYLEEHDVDFPRQHPLMPLLELCLSLDDEFDTLRRDLRRLDNYAVAVRYPGVTVSVELAEEALAAVARVRAFVRGKLDIA